MSSEKYSTYGSEFCNENGNGKDSVYGNANGSRKGGTKGIAISNTKCNDIDSSKDKGNSNANY